MKKILNYFKTTLYASSVNEGYARVLVSAFAAQLDPTVEEIADIKTAVSEAVTNCIVHAYNGSIGPIIITMKIYDPREFYIEIKDKGQGIPDVCQAMEPLYTTDRENERSGMGFTIMENFMDSLKVTSTLNKGTKICMSKKLAILPRVQL